MTNHQKDQILNVVQYYMTPELRERIMKEVPIAYNAWIGYPEDMSTTYKRIPKK
jgi:hypothetical protein